MIVDAVIIGRNEGERLVKALASVTPQVRRVVYVDSGSTDQSVLHAQDAGAMVVALDMTTPFTAARARNAGFAAIKEHGQLPDAVQFVDGDCAILPNWISAGSDHMSAHDDVALVVGQKSELNRDLTVFNQMSDVEWKRPAGDIDACSGNMMIRTSAFEEIGGFDPNVIAAEDDELCTRLRKASWRLVRIPVPMAQHDGGHMRFSQWWKRAERTGHGFAQVGHMHADYFVRERQRAWVYGCILPLLAIVGAFGSFIVPILVLGVYAMSYTRTMRGLEADGLPRGEAMRHAVFLTLSKFPNVIGMIRYHWRRLNNAQMRIIEYK